MISIGGWKMTAAIRAITAVPGHGIDGLAMGTSLVAASLNGNAKPWRFQYALLLPILLHAAYDFPLMAIQKNIGRAWFAGAWLVVLALSSIFVIRLCNRFLPKAVETDRASGRDGESVETTNRLIVGEIVAMIGGPLLAGTAFYAVGIRRRRFGDDDHGHFPGRVGHRRCPNRFEPPESPPDRRATDVRLRALKQLRRRPLEPSGRFPPGRAGQTENIHIAFRTLPDGWRLIRKRMEFALPMRAALFFNEFDVGHRLVALVDGHQIDAGLRDIVTACFQPGRQLLTVRLESLEQHDRLTSIDGLPRAFQRFQFHPFDVDLDKIHPWQVDFIERQFAG